MKVLFAKDLQAQVWLCGRLLGCHANSLGWNLILSEAVVGISAQIRPQKIAFVAILYQLLLYLEKWVRKKGAISQILFTVFE